MVFIKNNTKFSRYGSLFFLGFVFLTFNCSKDYTITDDLDLTNNQDSIANNSINGSWKWLKSINAWTQQVTTPLTEGYTMSLEFKINDTVCFFRNDSLIYNYLYELEYRVNNPLDSTSDSTLVLVFNSTWSSFFSIFNDTLIIDQSYVDGPIDYYERKN